MKTNITMITDILTVARDSYKNHYKAQKEKYEEDLKAIKRDFKPNTPRYLEEVQKAKEMFDNSVRLLQNEAKTFATKQIDELREEELAKVRLIDTTAMEKLSAVSSLPLSAAELSVLQNRFASGGSYWATKMIADMAEKNNLKPSQFLQSANLDTKLDILSQLEKQLDQLLDTYDASGTYHQEVLLCDPVLMRAERTYASGWALSSMEDSQVARRAFLQLKGKSIAEQAIGLQNIMNNATEETKRALFFEMANNAGVIEDAALNWAGIADEFESYQKKEHNDYTIARKSFEKTLTATSKEEVALIADDLTENTYYQKMLTETDGTNVFINDYLGTSGITAEAPQTATAE